MVQLNGYVGLELQGLGLLPTEVLVGEMAVLCRLEVDRPGKVKLLNDDTWPHVEVRPDDLNQFL